MKHTIKYQFLFQVCFFVAAMQTSDLPIKRDFIPKYVLGGTAALTACAYIAKSAHINLSAAVSFCALTAKHYWPQLMVATSFGVGSVVGIKKFVESSLISKLDFKFNSVFSNQQTVLPLKDCIAAGVLPYAFNDKKEILFLVGKNILRGGSVGDFGGQKDSTDSDIAMTAAREATEELMILFDEAKDSNLFTGDIQQTRSYQTLLPKEKCSYVVHQKSKYCMYFVEIGYDQDLSNKFKARGEEYRPETDVADCYKEIEEIMWVPAARLIHNISMMSQDAIDTMQKAQSDKEFGDITYYRYFIQSLWYAHQNNVLSGLLKSQ